MESNRNIASPFLRFLAFLVDLLILATLVLLFVFFVSQKDSLYGILDMLLNGVILLLLIPVSFALINTLLTAYAGGTIGKLLVGIRVEDESGRNLSFLKAFFRNQIGYSVSASFLGLGYTWILTDEKRQAWHDQVTGSFVVIRNKIMWILGSLAVIGLVILNLYLGSVSFQNFMTRGKLYVVIYEDIKSEIEKSFESEKEEVKPDNLKEQFENVDLERV